MTTPETVSPESPMRAVLAAFPGAQRALFAGGRGADWVEGQCAEGSDMRRAL